MKSWMALPLIAGVACAPPSPRSLYDWAGYDTSLYKLMKSPADIDAYGLALKKAIDRNPDGRRVAPGIYAEYGYVLFATGHKPEAADFFAKEKTRWPESARIMDRMIANCAPPPPPPPTPLPV
jgi:hypothetical protein